MSDSTPRLGLPEIAQMQEMTEVSWNETLVQLDALVNLYIVSNALSAPPASPSDGDCYIVAGSPTGAWSGYGGKIAAALDGAWNFYAPFKGLIAYVANLAALQLYTSGGWTDLSAILDFQNVPQIGVNTTASSTNKFACASSAALFTNIGSDFRLTMNKAAAANTASTLYQDNWSGRAEVGLCGDDNFHFKVSPDGSSWYDALDIAASGGKVTANCGLGVVGGSFGLSGNISAPAWTTNGIRYANVAATLTDTSSSGTVAAAYTDLFGGSTIAAAHAVTFTNYFGAYVKAPAAGTNVTFANSYALGADSMWTAKLSLPGSSSGTTVLQAAAAASGTLTLPAASDTLVGRATTDTLTNKTLSGASFTGTMGAVLGNNKFTFSSTSNSWGIVQFGNPGSKECSVAYIGNASGFGNPPSSSNGNTFIFNQGVGLYNSLGSQYSIANANYGSPIFLVDAAGGTAIGSYAGNAQNVAPPANGLIVSGPVGLGTAAPNSGPQLDVAGHIYPHTDNTYNLGSASYRFGTLYAGTGTINTSGAATKSGVRALDAAEIAAAKALAANVRVFQFVEAVTAKGADKARFHTGAIYEEVVAAFEAQGLDPMRYGIVCADPVDPKKSVLGLRYGELAQFVIAGMNARLCALEAAAG